MKERRWERMKGQTARERSLCFQKVFASEGCEVGRAGKFKSSSFILCGAVARTKTTKSSASSCIRPPGVKEVRYTGPQILQHTHPLSLCVPPASRPVDSDLCLGVAPSTTQLCHIACPVECDVSSWSAWGPCTFENCQDQAAKKGRHTSATRHHWQWRVSLVKMYGSV